MAVEKSAVREGTRWDFRGEVVVVDEVTPKSVIHYDEHGIRTDVTPIETFLKVAQDLERSKYDRLVKAFGEFGTARSRGKDPVADAIAYLLERIGPPAPVLDEPEPHPLLDVAEPLPASTIAALTEAFAVPADVCAVAAVAEAKPVEDHAVLVPVCTPVEEAGEEYERIARAFAASDDKPRNLKRKGGW